MKKKKKNVLFMISFLIIFLLMCVLQTSLSDYSDQKFPSFNWNKVFGTSGYDIAYSVAIDSNDYVYVVGTGVNLVSNNSNRDWWIKKFNSNGFEDKINWNKKYDGNGGIDDATAIAIDSNDYIYIVGYGDNLVSSTSKRDWWIKKFDSNGYEDTSNWNKKFDGNGSYDHAYSVAIDLNNNVYIVGFGYFLVGDYEDWWIKKFDSNGNEDIINWNKMFEGHEHLDCAYSVAIDSNNNVYVAGYGYNMVTSDSEYDWWIKKFDSNGNEDITNWDKKFHKKGFDYARSVSIDSNNNVYVVGTGEYLATMITIHDWWIKKFDSNGNEDITNWNKIFDGDYNKDVAYSVVTDSNNNVYVAGFGENLISGNSEYDWWIKKFNSNGNEDTTNWNKMFDGNGGRDIARTVTIDSNNNVYVVGDGNNLVSNISGRDWWIKRF